MAGLRRKLRAQKRGSCLTLKRAKEGGMLENSFDVMIFTYFYLIIMLFSLDLNKLYETCHVKSPKNYCIVRFYQDCWDTLRGISFLVSECIELVKIENE